MLPDILHLDTAANELGLSQTELVARLNAHGFHGNFSSPNTVLTLEMLMCVYMDIIQESTQYSMITRALEDFLSSSLYNDTYTGFAGFSSILYEPFITSRYKLGRNFLTAYKLYLKKVYEKIKATSSLKAIAKSLRQHAYGYIKIKFQSSFIRNIQQFYRRIVRFLFKNMDDNSGDDFTYQLNGFDKYLFITNYSYEIFRIPKNNSRNRQPHYFR